LNPAHANPDRTAAPLGAPIPGILSLIADEGKPLVSSRISDRWPPIRPPPSSAPAFGKVWHNDC